MNALSVQNGEAVIAAVRFGRGEPLVVAHALGFSKQYFVPAAEVLGAEHDCLAVDLRGHGGSSAVGESDGLGDLAADLRAAMDAVGWERAAVAGISLGSAVALRLALDEPDRVSILIQDLPAFSPGSAMAPAKARAISAALATGDADAATAEIAAGLPRAAGAALVKALTEDWSHYDDLLPRLATAFAAVNRFRVTEDWPGALGSVRVPVHLFGLRGDTSHPYEITETMAAVLPNAMRHRRAPSLSVLPVARGWIEALT